MHFEYDSSTPVFDQNSCPDALKNIHATAKNYHGYINVLEGELIFNWVDTKEKIVLQQYDRLKIDEYREHFLTIDKNVKFRVDFYKKSKFE